MSIFFRKEYTKNTDISFTGLFGRSYSGNSGNSGLGIKNFFTLGYFEGKHKVWPLCISNIQNIKYNFIL